MILPHYAAGVLKIEGTIVGDVHSEKQILVSAGGMVEGDIHAPEVVVGGAGEGSISATQRTELHPASVVLGDITTVQLEVHEGGHVNGRLTTGEDATNGKQVEKAPQGRILKMPRNGVAAAL